MNNTNWKFYLKSEDAWRAMKEACLNARTSIDIEQFILEKDDIGGEFFEVLVQKRREGVRIRILCDMVGSYDTFASSIPEALRDIGIEIRFWNVIKPWRAHTFFSWFFRDHRKIMVVDKYIGFTGGVGIRGDFRLWRDTHVKVTGAVVEEMQHSFEEMWSASEERNALKRIRKTRRFTKGFSFVTNSPFLKKRFFYQELVQAIRNAQESIYLTTPYFIPDRRLRRILIGASKRGVETIVLVPKQSNHIWADRAGQAYFEKLLRHGVKIFFYNGEMLHAKTAVIDTAWASVGSFNLDSLSILYNYEGNIVSTKKEVIEEVRGFFSEDLLKSEEITYEHWKNRSKREKLLEHLTLPIRRFL